MDEKQREDIARLIHDRRVEAFGTVTAATRAAQVNAETWARAERGDTIRDDRMAAIVKALWPATGGAVSKIDAELAVEFPAMTTTQIPVGTGVDAEVLAVLAELEPEKIQRVKDFIRGIQSGE